MTAEARWIPPALPAPTSAPHLLADHPLDLRSLLRRQDQLDRRSFGPLHHVTHPFGCENLRPPLEGRKVSLISTGPDHVGSLGIKKLRGATRSSSASGLTSSVERSLPVACLICACCSG